MTVAELSTLQDRYQYLGARIEAKKTVGWEYAYDERERAALGAALMLLDQIVYKAA